MSTLCLTLKNLAEYYKGRTLLAVVDAELELYRWQKSVWSDTKSNEKVIEYHPFLIAFKMRTLRPFGMKYHRNYAPGE